MGGVDSKGLGPWGGRLAAGCMGDSVFGKILYPLSVTQATSASLLNRCWEVQTGIVPGLLLSNTDRHCAWSPWRRLSSLCCSHSPIRLQPFSLTQCCTVSWTGSNSVTRCLALLFLQPWRPCPTHLDIHSSSPLAWTPPGLCSLQKPSRHIHSTQDFLSLLPALLGSPSGVSDLSPCSSWEVGIIPLWIYRDHLLSFIHNNLVLIFVCVCVCMVHSRRPTNSLIRNI